MVAIGFKDSGIEIDLQGIEKFIAIKSKLFIPYEHIESVNDNADEVKRYLRVGGTAIGYSHSLFGRFTTNEGLGFFVVRDKKKAFAINLVNEPYKVIVLELDNNEDAISKLRERIKSDGAK
ncbi:MAG: hypothetical protein ACP5MZ_02895 [Candidatus Micrarchaeia archaeon]